MKRGAKSKSPEEKRATAGARREEVRAGEPAESGEIETADPLFVEAEEEADPEVVGFPVPGEEFALREVSEEEIERLPPPPPEVVPSDPLHQYLLDISRHPLLTREEELELARRHHDEGDIEAAYRMVVSNLRLVVKIAYEFRRNLSNLLDLIQEGNIGLMRAVEKFDPARGVRLSSYAAWWIRAYMIRYILNNWSMVKIGTTQNQRRLFFNLRKEKEALEAQGFRPEPKLLASRLNVRESEVREMQMRLAGPDVSLDAPLDEGTETTRIELVRDTRAPVGSALEGKEIQRLIQDKLKEFRSTLDERDRQIFDERLLAEEPATLRDLGERFGVSRERVRQIEAELKDRLKEFLESFGEVRDALE